MFWVVQQKLFRNYRREDVISTLARFDIPHQLVDVQADASISPEVDFQGPIITNGSVLLSQIARKREWQPGSMLNDSFSYETWFPILRTHLLNQEAIFSTVRYAAPEWERVFVRPLTDTKAFDGRVMSQALFSQWQRCILDGSDRSIEPDTQILCAPVRKVGQEIRHYIVDGEVISSSRYKLDGVSNEAEVRDRAMTGFARDMAALWSPARAFVLDTYVTGSEMGIVELGCICHAGFYQADVQRIIMALDAMHWP